MRSFATLAALAFLNLAAAAQQQEAAAPIRSDVNEVLVPVIVKDGRGHYVSGLKASDFQVFEDGKPERIIGFGVESMTAAPILNDPVAGRTRAASDAHPISPPNPADPQQTYLIIVDTLHSSFANFRRVQKVLDQFFAKEKPGTAQYAVMALGRELNVVQDSTRDASAVLAAIRASAFSGMIQATESNNLATTADQLTAQMHNYCTVCQCISTGTHSDQPECPAAKSQVKMVFNGFAQRTFRLNQNFLQQLNQIVAAIAGMPTSRTVIFISDGFNRFAGRELYSLMMGYGPADRTFVLPPLDTQPELEAVLKTATSNGVRFYTIDSRGLYTIGSVPGSGFEASTSSAVNTQMDSRGSPRPYQGVPEAAISHAASAARESTDALAELARETGGLFFENSNDLMKGIRQAVADGREYYVLAYVPQNKTMDGTYRKITVTAGGGKFQIKAKAGYWAPAK